MKKFGVVVLGVVTLAAASAAGWKLIDWAYREVPK